MLLIWRDQDNFEKGRLEGRREIRLDAAKKMIEEKYPDDIILEVTEFSQEELDALKYKLQTAD